MSAGVKRRVSNSRELMFSKEPLHVSHQSVNCDHTAGKLVDLVELFNGEWFVESSEARKAFISTATGLPTEDPLETLGNTVKHRKSLEIYFNAPIISYSQITGDNGNFRLVMIGSVGRLHLIVVRGNVAFTFYINADVYTPREAVHALLKDNLSKCPRVYRSTATIINEFFEHVLGVVNTERTKIVCEITCKEGNRLPAAVYFDPDKPKESVVSILGFVFNHDINYFPAPQIRKAIERNNRI